MAEYMNYSNLHENNEAKGINKVSINEKDRNILRELAMRWQEIAKSDKMKEKKRLWKALKDLKPVRPMILFETLSVSGFIIEKDLRCENSLLRNVERTMMYSLRQYDLLDDDIVLEDYYRLAWVVIKSDYGIKIVEHHADNSMAYKSNFPIQTPDDYNKLKERTFRVDREQTLAFKNLLEEIFGDILPIKVGNYDNFFPDMGFSAFTGNNFIGITMDLFKLMGYDNMLLWPYDHPDELHRFMRFLCDDRVRFYKWMQEEKLLDFNSDNQFAGPSSYGYVSDLPTGEAKKQAELKDVWTWAESQETTTVSPKMFDEFFLPYIAEVSNMFGMSYYGCCEHLHDRIKYIMKAMPNLRTVSVSGWSDLYKMGEILGKDYVYSRKPTPSFISGKNLDWDNAQKDIVDTYKATKNGCLEVIVRDVYDINGDIPRLRKWVDMTKGILGI